MRIVLAGVAGVGKTTVAKLLARKLGLPYRSVEAPKCWPLSDPLERQLCFLCSFQRKLRRGPGIYDNSMLTVAAYSAIYNSTATYGVAVAALAIAKTETSRIVLAARPRTLRERIVRRLEDPQRQLSAIEQRIDLHIAAQQTLLRFAKSLDNPVIWTDDKPAETVASEVMKLMRAEVAADA